MKRRTKMAAAAACGAVAAALYCSHAIETEDWEIASSRLPAAFDGLRITLITDVHGASFGPENGRLTEAVERSRPDLLALCGDLVDEGTDRATVAPLIRQLGAFAPMAYVPGNHECALNDENRILKQLESIGVLVLRNRYALVKRGGQQIVLAGADDPFTRGPWEDPAHLMERIRTRIPGDPYVLMLYHRNNSLNLWSSLGADTVLAGHGHGGVIRLPLVGGLLSVERTFFPKDCDGVYRRGRTALAVSRGVGGARLWNRPHVPTVVLRRRPEP